MKTHLHDWVGEGDRRKCSRCKVGLLEHIRKNNPDVPWPAPPFKETRIAPEA